MPEQTGPAPGRGEQPTPTSAAQDAQQQFAAHAQPVADALRAQGKEPEARQLEGAAQVITNARKALASTAINLRRMDEERDNFVRNAQPMADALRKTGKPAEAKQLEEAARIIGETKGLGPEQAGKVAQPAAEPDKTLKQIMDDVFATIDKDPVLRRMPETQGLRQATTALEKNGMLNITVRNGVVVSFASNFADNFGRTNQVAAAPKPTPKVASASATLAAAVPTPMPAPAFTASPAYTSYGPSTDSGVIEGRKTTLAALPQLNVAITDQGAFGINPQVSQERLIGDGMSALSKFFEYEMPSAGFKLAHVGLAEPGQLKQTEQGWEVVIKGKLALTDTAGNVFQPALSSEQQVTQVVHQAPPAPARPVGQVAPAPAAPPALAHPFGRADIPDALLQKLGVQAADLEQSGQFEKLLQGQKTDLIEGFSLTGISGERIPFAAKLVLHRDEQGVATLKIDLPKHDLVIPKQIMGKTITPAMQVELQQNGVLPLTPGFTDGHGRAFSAYLGVDKQMNRVVAVRREAMDLHIPQVVLGVRLDPEVSRQLLEGKATKLVGLTNSKSQVFDATVQLDPVKRQLTFREVQVQQVPQVQRRRSPGL